MNKGTEGMTILITGATSGIGYELSQVFAEKGFDLVLVARDLKKLEGMAGDLAGRFGVSAAAVSQDLSQPGAPEMISRELDDRLIKVDILVNNAGFNEYGRFWETDPKKEMEMIQVNLVSLTQLTKLLLPGMLSRGYGRIMNVGSTGSFAPGPFNAVYCATKAYVLSFSEAIAEELRGTGVSMTALCPGATETEFARRAKMEDVRISSGNTMSAKEVAELGYRALMLGKTSVVAGFMNNLTVFSLRFIPRRLTLKVSKSMMSREKPRK